MTSALQVFEFEGAPIRAYVFRGRPCWIAQDVGGALGYTRVGFGNALREWSDEFIDDKDLSTLRGQDLREFRSVAADTVSVSAKTTQLTVLYESGVDLVCIKTEKPLGKKLRRFMADEVMPRLRRGSLEPSRAEKELIALTLRLNAGDAETIWELETVQELCRIYAKQIWDGASRMDPWLRRPMWMIYEIVLGPIVYPELKLRNPDPHDGSLNYQFLTEAKHRLMQNDMGTVRAILRMSRDADDFFNKLKFAYRRGPLQLGW